MFTIAGLVTFVIQAIIVACIVGILLWIISIVPIPEPFKGWIRITVLVVVGLIVITFLMQFAGWIPPLIKHGP